MNKKKTKLNVKFVNSYDFCFVLIFHLIRGEINYACPNFD